jgi:21S rRNA (GM2251-2'-O)-methyltransferase
LQGYILRCGNFEFESLSRIPLPGQDENAPSLWLVLDEVVDPQNFGALLRSAYFLGGASATDKAVNSSIGIMVCSKNSAPPSAVVSAASAGALELSQIYSTNNLPRTLNAAREEGWRILGAAASAPNGTSDAECLDLQSVETGDSQPPTILVLGSEGHGLRTLVAKACTGFVRVPGSEAASVEGDTNAGVDSLNVSVTGGIMLWHFLNGKN